MTCLLDFVSRLNADVNGVDSDIFYLCGCGCIVCACCIASLCCCSTSTKQREQAFKTKKVLPALVLFFPFFAIVVWFERVFPDETRRGLIATTPP